MSYRSRPFDRDDGYQRASGNAFAELNNALDSLQANVERAQRRYPSQGGEELDAIRRRQAQLERHHRTVRPSRKPDHTAELREELANLRRDLARERASGSGRAPAMPAPAMQTRREAAPPVRRAATNTESRNTAMSSDIRQLHAEIAQIKSDVTRLASEDSVRDLADKWGTFEREMASLPDMLGTRKDLMNVAARVDDLYEMLSELPRTLPVTSMETQLRELATAVEHIAMSKSGLPAAQLEKVEARLDEISRAVVTLGTTVAQTQFDSAPLDRIEARIATLTRQLEEQAQAEQDGIDDFDRRFSEIGHRLDALHASTERAFSEDTLSALNERFDQVAGAIGDLTRMAQSDGSSPQDLAAIDSMAIQLSEVLDGLNAQRAHTSQTMETITRSLDERMEELAHRISEQESASSAIPGLQNLEQRMDEIAALMSAGQVLSHDEPGAGPDLSGLEAQIADLSRQLQESAAPAATGGSELSERLAAIEARLETNEDDIMATALKAAEQAVANTAAAGSPQEAAFVSQMADRLNELDALARDSNSRNEQTFEAIHDTLLKVVDHLSGLETGMAEQSQPAVSNDWGEEHAFDDAPDGKMSLEEAPPLDYAQGADEPVARTPSSRSGDTAGFDDRIPETRDRASRLSPAEAAASAALAALNNEQGVDSMGQTPEGDGGLTAEPRVSRPQYDDGYDAVEEELLEPGSGGPDLASIIQRVREERNDEPIAGRPQSTPEAGKKDFIAAARRRAKAAAADTEMVQRAADEAGKSRRATDPDGRLAGLKATFANKRKPILMGAGAILLALLAVPIVSNLMSPVSVPVAQIEQSAAVDPDAMTPADGNAGESILPGGEAEMAEAAPVQATDQPVREIELPTEAPVIPEVTAAIGEQQTAEPEEEVVEAALIDDTEIPAAVNSVALREAAATGDPKALYVVAEKVLATNGTGADGFTQSAEWYRKSADLGYAPAQYRIGNMLEKGTGVDRDLTGAMTYYQLAAQQGNVSAMHNLAVLLASGAEGTPDMESASSWFLKAAERGVTDSQYNLGVLYGTGRGVPQDLVESYKWFSLVAKAGDTAAAGPRDDVAAQLAPADLERARGAVELWNAKPADEAANAVTVPPEWQSAAEQTASVEPAQDPAEMKKAIRNIQAILNNAGYDAGPVDGMMGGKTREAIMKFQKDNGLAETGNIDRPLVEKLLEVNNAAG